NGVNWTVTHSFGDRLNAITYGGGLFVAVGRETILTSLAGDTWGQHSADRFLQGVAYGNGRFVAGGKSGTIMISTHGGSYWIEQPTPFYTGIEDMQFANGVFIAVGNNGFIATSPDGVVWTLHTSLHRPDFRSVTYTDSRFVIVGNNEAILQS